MKNDIQGIITKLELKRKEIDLAIDSLRKINLSGLLNGAVMTPGLPVARSSELAGLSVFKGALSLLGAKKQPMKTKEISDAIIASGKEINSTNPANIISTTLYKALRDKKHGELTYNRKTKEWGLRGWKA